MPSRRAPSLTFTVYPLKRFPDNSKSSGERREEATIGRDMFGMPPSSGVMNRGDKLGTLPGWRQFT